MHPYHTKNGGSGTCLLRIKQVPLPPSLLMSYLRHAYIGIRLREILDSWDNLDGSQELRHRLPGGAIVVAEVAIAFPDGDGCLQHLRCLIDIHARHVGFTELHSLRRIVNHV